MSRRRIVEEIVIPILFIAGCFYGLYRVTPGTEKSLYMVSRECETAGKVWVITGEQGEGTCMEKQQWERLGEDVK